MAQTDIRVLIVDDDEDMRATLLDFISKLGVKVRTSGELLDAQRLIRTEGSPFDLILTDLKLPGGSGLDIVEAARARSPETLVTILTGYASLETAIEAIRLGAYDYITKPFSLDEIGVEVRNMIERVSLSKENTRLSVRLQELYEQVNRLQNEKAEISRFLDEIRREVKETNRRLDTLIVDRALDDSETSLRSVPKRQERVSSLLRELEKIDRLKASSALSHFELEEKRRLLIEQFMTDSGKA